LFNPFATHTKDEKDVCDDCDDTNGTGDRSTVADLKVERLYRRLFQALENGDRQTKARAMDYIHTNKDKSNNGQ